jgi:hypothetical protein
VKNNHSSFSAANAMPFFRFFSFRRKPTSDPLVSRVKEDSNITVTTEISRTITPVLEPLHSPSPTTPPPRLIARAATVPLNTINETPNNKAATSATPSLLRRTLSTSSKRLGSNIKRALSSSSRHRSNSLSVNKLRRTNSSRDKLLGVKEEGSNAGEQHNVNYDEELETWKCCYNDEDEVVGGDPRLVSIPMVVNSNEANSIQCMKKNNQISPFCAQCGHSICAECLVPKNSREWKLRMAADKLEKSIQDSLVSPKRSRGDKDIEG